MKTRFSLVSLAFCLGLFFDAYGAPSVRVLGSGAGYSTGTKAVNTTNVKVANTGNNIPPSVLNTSSGTNKSASVKSFSPKTTTVTPVARTASTRPGSIATTKKTTVKTTATKSDTERFPGIVGKSNVKDLGTLSVVTNPTTSASTSTGYDIREMNERLMNVENSVDKKADKVELSDYYTKQDIDSNFYTRDQVEDRLGEIDTSASSAYLRTLASQVELHSQQILELSAEQTGLYDQHTNTAQNVYIETDFNENVLDIEDESNEG